MKPPLARLGMALIVLLAIPAAPPRAAPAGEPGATKALRAASFEPASPAVGAGRFRLSARLHPAPLPHVAGQAHSLELNAALAPKASGATCPLPGAIFADGFESP